MSDLDSIRKALQERSTDDLVAIVKERDEEEWRPEVFDMAAAILAERGISPQEIERQWDEMKERATVAEEQLPQVPMEGRPEEYVRVASGLGPSDVATIGAECGREGMPFFLDAHEGSYSMAVYVPPEHASRARAILEKGGFIPPQPPETEPPVGAEGGPCPACGTTVVAGSVECPECQLVLAERVGTPEEPE